MAQYFAVHPTHPQPLADAPEIRAALEHGLDLIVDSGPCGIVPTTVIDLAGEAPVVLRRGRGPLEIVGRVASL